MGGRDKDIREKIAYAQVRLNQLSQDLKQSQATEEHVEFVGQKVGEILSLCRECFDYAAKDISDRYIGKTRKKPYFPMTKMALQSGAFGKLQESNPEIYGLLSAYASVIEENKAYKDTELRAGVAKEVNDLVNAKKHDRITVTKRRENSATAIKFPGGQEVTMSPVFPVDGNTPRYGEDVGAEPMVASHPGIEIRYVPEYRLAANGWEISWYCSHAIGVTWRILDEIYAALNPGNEVDTFSPGETLKSADQVRYEKFLKSAEHIVISPVAVEFFIRGDWSNGVLLKNSYETESGTYLGGLIKEVYEAYVRPVFVYKKYSEILRDNFENPEKQAFEEEHWNIVFGGERIGSIPLPDGRQIEFDKTVWHFTTRFRQAKQGGGGFVMMNPQIQEKIVLLFPNFQYQYVIGARPLNG